MCEHLISGDDPLFSGQSHQRSGEEPWPLRGVDATTPSWRVSWKDKTQNAAPSVAFQGPFGGYRPPPPTHSHNTTACVPLVQPLTQRPFFLPSIPIIGSLLIKTSHPSKPHLQMLVSSLGHLHFSSLKWSLSLSHGVCVMSFALLLLFEGFQCLIHIFADRCTILSFWGECSIGASTLVSLQIKTFTLECHYNSLMLWFRYLGDILVWLGYNCTDSVIF